MKGINRNEMIAVSAGIIVVAGILLIGIINSLSGNVAEDSVTHTNTTMATAQNELQIEDIVIGTGAEAVAGSVVTTHYTGMLEDGTVFDSSLSRGVPFNFTLGIGQVIRGWDMGIAGMKVGGKRKLVIPAELAYGERAIGAIPANATLIFEVELLNVAAQQ